MSERDEADQTGGDVIPLEGHAKLVQALTELPDIEPPAGWEARVLGRVAARRRQDRQRWLGAALAASLVAGAVVTWQLTQGPRALTVELVAEGQVELMRGASAGVGSTLRFRGPPGDEGVRLWLYRNQTEPLLACPGGEGCVVEDGRIAGLWVAKAPGIYEVLAIGGDGRLLPDSGLTKKSLPELAAEALDARLEVKISAPLEVH